MTILDTLLHVSVPLPPKSHAQQGEQKMKTSVVAFLAVIVGLLMASSPMSAHHGTNISYDHAKPTTMTGTVTEFVWQNPHCQVYFDVKGPDGAAEHWAGELNSPGVLARSESWTRKTVNVGDVITVTLFPSKAGTPVGVVSKIERDGKVILSGRGGGAQ